MSRLASNLCTQTSHKIWRLEHTYFHIQTNNQVGWGMEDLTGLPDVPSINHWAIVTWVTIGCRRATIKPWSIAILFPEGKKENSRRPKSQSLPHSQENNSYPIRQKHTLPCSQAAPWQARQWDQSSATQCLQHSFLSVIAGAVAALPHPKIIPNPTHRSDAHALSQSSASPAAVFGTHAYGHMHTRIMFSAGIEPTHRRQPRLRFLLQIDSCQWCLQKDSNFSSHMGPWKVTTRNVV